MDMIGVLESIGKDELILLVGEGDFSFTLSLLEKYDVRSQSVIATTLEDPERSVGSDEQHKESDDRDVKRIEQLTQDNSQRINLNVKTIRKTGAKVVYGVNATLLHEHMTLGCMKFHHIIFNFPHVGGRSKIHLNRKLLKDFFMSAVKVLTSNGSIMVSLCGGQGGVSVDSVQREWANTWQVVGMAAYADLVLVKVEPFCAELFPDYTCTGRRSKGRPFFMKGALTYTFKRGVPVYPIDPLSPVRLWECIHFGDYCYTFPKYFLCWLERTMQNDLPPVVRRTSDKISSLLSLPKPQVVHISDLVISERHDYTLDTESFIFVYGRKCLQVECQSEHDKSDRIAVCNARLIANPEEFLSLKNIDISCRPTNSYSYCIPSFSNCAISKVSPPVSYYLCGAEETTSFDYFVTEIKSVLIEFLTNSEIIIVKKEEKCWKGISLTCVVLLTGFSVLCEIYKPVKSNDKSFVYYNIDLYQLSKCLHNVEDWRLLWSAEVLTVNKQDVLIPVSLYPPSYEHDISFWESSDKICIEEELLEAVRNVCGDLVVSVRQFDRYYHDTQQRFSRTYTITYEGLKQPLTREQACLLQETLRNYLLTQANIQVR